MKTPQNVPWMSHASRRLWEFLLKHGARAWNSLPPETRVCCSLDIPEFYLFHQSYGWLGAVHSDRQSANVCVEQYNSFSVWTLWSARCMPPQLLWWTLLLLLLLLLISSGWTRRATTSLIKTAFSASAVGAAVAPAVVKTRWSLSTPRRPAVYCTPARRPYLIFREINIQLSSWCNGWGVGLAIKSSRVRSSTVALLRNNLGQVVHILCLVIYCFMAL